MSLCRFFLRYLYLIIDKLRLQVWPFIIVWTSVFFFISGSFLRGFYCTSLHACSTDMRRLTTGIRSGKCVVRRFRRCANVIIFTIMRRLTTGIRSGKCVVRRFRRCANVIMCTDKHRLTMRIRSKKRVVKQFRCVNIIVYLHKLRQYKLLHT
jgi:hypothetical protein